MNLTEMSSSFKSTTHPFPGDLGQLLASQGALRSPAPATNPSSPALEREEPLEGARRGTKGGSWGTLAWDRFCVILEFKFHGKSQIFFLTLILDNVTGFEQK